MAVATRPDWQTACRADSLAEGETEHWRIRRFEVGEEHDLQMFMTAFHGGRGRTPHGTYTRLERKTASGGAVIVMSDTRDEMRDLGPLFWAHPHGRVLVNGLGLGCVIRGLLAHPEVTHIDVVELDQEVIDLVGSQFTDPRLAIHRGDAFTYEWPKGTTWDFVWHDVWDDLSSENLSNEATARPGTYARLNRRYGRRAGWQGAWGQGYLQSERRRGGW